MDTPTQPEPDPEQCPACGSSRVAYLLYGFPSPFRDFYPKLASGEIRWANGDLTEDAPEWHCGACHHEWGVAHFPPFLRSLRQQEAADAAARLPATEIDLRAVASIEELHSVFARALDFPDSYGRNWDAFWDAIAGLVKLPPRVRLIGWHDCKSRFPRDTMAIRRCFEDYRNLWKEQASEIEYA
jgi:ribonuclease inhibitor